MTDVRLPIELVEAVLVDLRIQATRTGAPVRRERIAAIEAALEDARLSDRPEPKPRTADEPVARAMAPHLCLDCGHLDSLHEAHTKQNGEQVTGCWASVDRWSSQTHEFYCHCTSSRRRA